MTVRTVVITGAASGIGATTAARMTASSWSVAGVGHRVTSPGVTLEWVVGDVSDHSVLRKARERAEQLGSLSAWVNCAGIPGEGS